MAKKLTVGDKAPGFDLPDDSGGKLTLKAFAGKKLVLYFYPKDDTSGCTKEAIDFNAMKSDFAKAGATIVGVSPDSVASHAKFKKKHELGLALASDRNQSDARSLWSLGRKKHVWAQIYGGRAHDLSDRFRR